MIVGVGIDLISISKISKSIKSESFRHKVFTPAEIEFCESFTNAAEHYAGKFAAKEAFMKALGKGIRQEVWFTQIEVLNYETGAPYIQVSGEAKRTLASLDVERVHISLSHTKEMAIAIIIFESNN